MCNCIAEVTQKILAAEAKKPGRPPRNIHPIEDMDGNGGLQNQYFTLGASDTGYKLYTTFAYWYVFTKINGSTSAPKKETVNMYFTYCPFCGVKY